MDVCDRPTAPTEVEGPDGEPILVALSTGCGDGHYPTWVGRTAGGEVACFVTDFSLFPDETTAGEAGTRCRGRRRGRACVIEAQPIRTAVVGWSGR